MAIGAINCILNPSVQEREHINSQELSKYSFNILKMISSEYLSTVLFKQNYNDTITTCTTQKPISCSLFFWKGNQHPTPAIPVVWQRHFATVDSVDSAPAAMDFLEGVKSWGSWGYQLSNGNVNQTLERHSIEVWLVNDGILISWLMKQSPVIFG